jgi:hypothetical protein
VCNGTIQLAVGGVGRISNYSFDRIVMIGTDKPKNVSSVKILLRIFDIFAGTFQAITGEIIPFIKLSQVEQIKVFSCTGTVPAIKDEMIRVYYNFALYCKERINNNLSIFERTVKEHITQECSKFFPGRNLEEINVTQLMLVCLLCACLTSYNFIIDFPRMHIVLLYMN